MEGEKEGRGGRKVEREGRREEGEGGDATSREYSFGTSCSTLSPRSISSLPSSPAPTGTPVVQCSDSRSARASST